jgi:phosphinothricin acetyltransferase
MIRPARFGDVRAVQGIYAHHVAHGTATFDTAAPDTAFWKQKIDDILRSGWPFLVAEIGGEVRGYCYAARFRDRAAYVRTCENSIYVADRARGQGVGGALLTQLIVAAREAGFEQMIAVIGGGEPASIAVHAKAGFLHAGRLRNVGFKFGRRLDTVYMQCNLTQEATE